MKCGRCGAPLEEGDRFCEDCGAAVGGCPSCGSPVTAGKRFCRACGYALAEPVPAPTTASREDAGPETVAERRVCSILFCDVVGFTPLSEALDPEAVRELLSEYFTVARTMIGRYGGVVEKFIGDAVMAVWGTPVATEDDAERAVRAAMDLVAAVAVLGTQAGVPGLAARAGVVTGEVAVTIGATQEGMVAGDAVNTAARIQAAAEPGSVLADAATQRLAGRSIEFTAAGTHALKGKAEPQELWRAARVVSGVGGSQRIDGMEAPLTGRDAELRTIRELFHAAAERRVPRLVLVSGPAGVGKSRLGWEFEKYADGLAADLWWHRGRCLSYGDGVAFWALAEIIRQRLGIAEDDAAPLAGTKLAAGLDQFVADPAERDYISPRLGQLLGVAATGEDATALSREELFAGWRLFLERLAAAQPVVLLVEDAQHADGDLLDFLEHLIDWVRDLPIFVLVFARPELGQIRAGFGTGRNRSTLTLDPLGPASMASLIDALVPGMPTEARARITSQAEGIPLFAVETVRALIDRDVIQPVDGVYRLTGDVGDLTIPETLHALLAARLDALDPAVRRLTAAAAVLGTTFPAEALIAVSGQDEQTVRNGLAELLRREVLSVTADPLSPERGSYQFTQDMLRQVAYDTLSRRDRRARHLAVAAYLRQAFPGDGEEVAEVVARHYLDAVSAMPDDPDSGTIRLEVITAYLKAAERARRTGAQDRASTSYGTAAQLILDLPAPPPELPDPGVLLEQAADVALGHGDSARALDYAQRARAYHLQHGRQRAAAWAHALAAEALLAQGRFTEARDMLVSALASMRAEPGEDTVRALSHLALAEVFTGSPDADQHTTEALVLGQAIDTEPGRLASLLSIRGIDLATISRRVEGIAYFTQAVRMAEQSGNGMRQGEVLVNLADTLSAIDPAGAAEAARTAAGHLRQAGERPLLAGAIGNLASAQLLLGDWDGASDLLAEAIDADGLDEFGFLLVVRAWLAALRGDTGTARAIQQSMPASEDLQEVAVAALVESLIATADGEPGQALAHARRALSHADTLGVASEALRWAWPLALRSAHELGSPAAAELLDQLDSYPAGHLTPMLRAERDLAATRTAARDGTPGSRLALADAVVRVREHSTPYHLAHALLDYHQLCLRDGDAEAAAQAVTEVREIADRLRCQPLLARISTIELATESVSGHSFTGLAGGVSLDR